MQHRKHRRFLTALGAIGLSVLLSTPVSAAEPPVAEAALAAPDRVAAGSAAGQRTTTEFAFVSRDPAPRDSQAASFAPENRRAGKALPRESAEDVAERVKASRKLREGADEGPSTKRQNPDINVCMEDSRTYREYGWTIDHFFHCQGRPDAVRADEQRRLRRTAAREDRPYTLLGGDRIHQALTCDDGRPGR